MYITPSIIYPIIAVLLAYLFARGYNAIIDREDKKGRLKSLPILAIFVAGGVFGVLLVIAAVNLTMVGPEFAKDQFLLSLAIFISAGFPMAVGEYRRWERDADSLEELIERLEEMAENNFKEAAEQLDDERSQTT